MQSSRNQLIWPSIGSALLGMTLLTGGCSPQSTAASAVTAAAASAVTSAAAAVTQPSTQPVAVTVGTASKSIVGRWVYRKPFSYGDGNPAPDAVAVIVFNKDGSYEASSHAGYGPMMAVRGTFQAFGTSLTTHVGKTATTFTYHVQDAHLILTNTKTKTTITYDRG